MNQQPASVPPLASLAALSLVAVMALVGCGDGSEQGLRAARPSPTGVPLPSGTATEESPGANTEVYRLNGPESYAAASDFYEREMPTGKPFLNLSWCGALGNRSSPSSVRIWYTQDPALFLSVSLENQDAEGTMITVSRAENNPFASCPPAPSPIERSGR